MINGINTRTNKFRKECRLAFNKDINKFNTLLMEQYNMQNILVGVILYRSVVLFSEHLCLFTYPFVPLISIFPRM
jgi:hypothetical protein